MDEKITYFNDLLVRFEEIFYHELSGMTHPKVEYVGTDFLKSKNIEGNTVEEVIDNCIKEIVAGGLVEEITYFHRDMNTVLDFKEKVSYLSLKSRTVFISRWKPSFSTVRKMKAVWRLICALSPT